jgi:Protein of unknown function (DUF3987)
VGDLAAPAITDERNGALRAGQAPTLRQGYRPGGYLSGARLTPGPDWPALDAAAMHGLPGRIVRAMEPHTEADPMALLISLLCAFGNAIGRGAFFRVGSDVHHLNLFAALVGESSKARKGMSWNFVEELMGAVDEGWVGEHVASGLSTGEGLIYHVRDRVEGEDKDGEPIVLDAGVEDKRLLAIEAELGGLLKVMGRDGNTLSPVIRQAWDGGRLRTLTKNSPLKATDAHISVVGHVTKTELMRQLTETEAANGFANRYLWVLVRRSKLLPRGGEWPTVDKTTLISQLRSALDFGKQPIEIELTDEAWSDWEEIYGPLSEGKPGMFGAVTGHAEAQVLRIAALFAVMDESAYIEREHLAAALAVWHYAEDSARHIFGDATGDPVADTILLALGAAGEDSITRTQIRDHFGRNLRAERITQALALLLKDGRLSVGRESTAGRPVERWFLR